MSQKRFDPPIPASSPSSPQNSGPAIDLDLARGYFCQDIVARENGYMSYIVHLNPNVTQTVRDEHTKRIEGICNNFLRSPQGAQSKMKGVEYKLTTTIKGYVGTFTDNIVKEIDRDRTPSGAVLSVTENQDSEQYADVEWESTTHPTWGASNMCFSGPNYWSDPDAEWRVKPDGIWRGVNPPYPFYKMKYSWEGSGSMIFLIDKGGFVAEDIGRDRLFSEGQTSNGEMYSHSTMMVNVMAGDSRGIAPKANIWLYSKASKLTKISVLLCFEKIALLQFGPNSEKWLKPGADSKILCLPFGFADTSAIDSANPLAASLRFLIEKKNFKAVTAAPNNRRLVTAYTTFPQNMESLILVGGSDKESKRAEHSDCSKKISFYAPSVDIAMHRNAVLGSAPVPANVNMNASKATGNCFAAAYVCGLIALMMTDENNYRAAGTNQEDMKSLLEGNFALETPDPVAGNPVNNIFKLFTKYRVKPFPTAPDQNPNQGAAPGRGVNGGALPPSGGRQGQQGGPPASTTPPNTLTIKQLGPEAFAMTMAGAIQQFTKSKMEKRDVATLLGALDSSAPDYGVIARLLNTEQAGVEKVFGEIRKFTFLPSDPISWDIPGSMALRAREQRTRIAQFFLVNFGLTASSGLVGQRELPKA